jgi:hypothetical protein
VRVFPSTNSGHDTRTALVTMVVNDADKCESACLLSSGESVARAYRKVRRRSRPFGVSRCVRDRRDLLIRSDRQHHKGPQGTTHSRPRVDAGAAGTGFQWLVTNGCCIVCRDRVEIRQIRCSCAPLVIAVSGNVQKAGLGTRQQRLCRKCPPIYRRRDSGSGLMILYI